MKSFALVSLVSLFAAGTAFAADGQSSAKFESTTTSLEKGFTPFIGLGGGMTDFDHHSDTDAPAGAVKILGSYATGLGMTDVGRYVFDLGLGLQSQKFASKFDLGDVTHKTLELAARYRWDSKWQAGALWNTHFEKGDSYGSVQGDAQFIGLQVLKELAVSDRIMARLGGHLMTGVQTTSVGATTAMIDLHLGWTNAKKTSEPAVAAVTPAAAPAPVAAMNPAPTDAATLARAELAKDSLAHFAVGSAKLTAADRKRVGKIGAALARGSSLFEKVIVVGHTDITGTEKLNMPLSQHRAQAVAAALIAAGVPKAKVGFEGESSAHPIATTNDAKAMSMNRRAGLKFMGAKNGEQLSSIVK